ncbi:DUF6114 domain-containing protein [Micromonosporaceae bacterium DT194]|uniref:DUF6114 domain-containing protein n=1 Tax=Melissospora conviva TaxID=3388432 RepID=UPI003C22B6BE
MRRAARRAEPAGVMPAGSVTETDEDPSILPAPLEEPSPATAPLEEPTSATAAPAASPRLGLRLRWRRWRRTRPFWAAVFAMLGGAITLASVRAPLPIVLEVGMRGLATYLVPLLLTTAGVLLLINPSQRLFYAIVAIVMALTSWLTSNLGGFFLGMLLGLVGGALALAWAPTTGLKEGVRRRRRAGRTAPS